MARQFWLPNELFIDGINQSVSSISLCCSAGHNCWPGYEIMYQSLFITEYLTLVFHHLQRFCKAGILDALPQIFFHLSWKVLPTRILYCANDLISLLNSFKSFSFSRVPKNNTASVSIFYRTPSGYHPAMYYASECDENRSAIWTIFSTISRPEARPTVPLYPIILI